MNIVMIALVGLSASASYAAYKLGRKWTKGKPGVNTEITRTYGIRAGSLLLLMFCAALIFVNDLQPLTWQKVIILVMSFAVVPTAAGLGYARRQWSSTRDATTSS